MIHPARPDLRPTRVASKCAPGAILRWHHSSLIVTIITLAAIALPAQKVYWANYMPSEIRRADTNGGNVELLHWSGTAASPTDITADLVGGKIYWCSTAPDGIRRSNLDGTNFEVLVSTPGAFCCGIKLDVARNHMYWTSYDDDTIRRADLDGSNHIVIHAFAMDTWPRGIGLDLTTDKMYYQLLGPQQIRRSNLDGTVEETLITGLGGFPHDLDIDVARGKIYWVEYGALYLRRSNLDGTNIENLYTIGFQPRGIALDLVADKVWWTKSNTPRKIQRSDPLGMMVEDVIVNPAHVGDAWGITLGSMVPPTCTFVPPTPAPMATITGVISFHFDVANYAGNSASATLEFSTDAGATFSPATDAGSGSLTGNPTAPISVPATPSWAWDSTMDIPGAATAVSFRITLTDTVTMVRGACSLSLDVDNTPTCTVDRMTPYPASGIVPFEITPTSATGAPLSASFEYTLDSGATWQLASPYAASTNPLTGLSSGLLAPFEWNSVADLVGTMAPALDVIIRATVTDAVSPISSTCATAPFTIDNVCTCGDCNQNGIVPEILDALTSAQIGVAIIAPSPIQNLCCDSNATLTITILDALSQAQAAVGLPVILMCP